MCRFVAYFGGAKIPMQSLLQDPENSLVSQSHAAKEGTHGINADGFGVAWYNFETGNEPGIFRSVQPAWNDSNLKHIAKKIRSKCFLAHIRASTVGDVTFNNCHPFYHELYSFAHNGTIRNFKAVRKSLIDRLDEDLLACVKAQTDSEHLFFLIMQFLRENGGNDLEKAVHDAFNWVSEVQYDKGEKDFAIMNIVITNGTKMIATRFTSKNGRSLSLNYATSSAAEILKHGFVRPDPYDDDMASADDKSIIFASEPLTDCASMWNEVPPNSYVIVDSEKLELEIKRF